MNIQKEFSLYWFIRSFATACIVLAVESKELWILHGLHISWEILMRSCTVVPLGKWGSYTNHAAWKSPSSHFPWFLPSVIITWEKTIRSECGDHIICLGNPTVLLSRICCGECPPAPCLGGALVGKSWIHEDMDLTFPFSVRLSLPMLLHINPWAHPSSYGHSPCFLNLSVSL